VSLARGLIVERASYHERRHLDAPWKIKNAWNAHFVGGNGPRLVPVVAPRRVRQTTAQFPAQSQTLTADSRNHWRFLGRSVMRWTRSCNGRFREFWPNPHRWRTEKPPPLESSVLRKCQSYVYLTLAVRWPSGRRRRFAKRKLASRPTSIFLVNPSVSLASPIRRLGCCWLRRSRFGSSQGQF
jgi:hypothetical protein